MHTVLLLEHERGTAYLFGGEMDCDLDVVGDFDERDAAVHSVVFAIEDHFAVDVLETLCGAGQSESELFGVCDTADGEVAIDFESGWRGLNDLRRMERDRRIVLHVEKLFALELAILHAASGIDGVGLDLDVEDTGSDVGSCEGEGGVPLVELACELDRCFHVELDVAFVVGDVDDGNALSGGWRGKQKANEKRERHHSHEARV